MWPDWLIVAIHEIKDFFNWFRVHQWMGIPLDLLIRFLILGVVYWIARKKTTLKKALLISLAILLGKEVFDTFAVRSWHKIHWPGFLDFEDVMSGLIGMGTAEIGYRWMEWMKSESDTNEEEGVVEAVGD